MRSIHFLIKPASSRCNLRCRYCFYEDEAENRLQKDMGMMTEETAERLLTEAYGLVEPGGTVSFAFQGGEPTLAGLDFFRRFTAQARKRKPAGVRLAFSIQTNGILLDESWADFFHREGFLVGISLDGFEALHDANRVDVRGEGTWKRLQEKVRLLQSCQVETNALCVVTGACSKKAGRVYQSLRGLGFDYLQFIACLDPIGGARGGMAYSLLPEDYGTFLCQLFDLWYRDWKRGKYCSIRLFEDYVHILLGDGGSTCATCGQCGSYFLVEGDGSVYPCDFYAMDDWKLGHLGQTTLAEMAAGEELKRFFSWGREKPAECTQCRWRALCNGGCKNDWVQDGDSYHNYYCAAFRRLFDYAGERMLEIARAEQRARGGM